MNKKLWSGRFTKKTNEALDEFNSSILFDVRLYKQDIDGSIAHTKGLMKQNIISADDGELIISGLKNIMKEIESGNFEFNVSSEDIHMNIEKNLIDKIGDAGKKMHTGRSRNDQVALDTHMYVKNACDDIVDNLKKLCSVLFDIADDNLDTIMPGFTHMQKAQPITLAFHMMAYFEMFKRDIDRFLYSKKNADVMPLGAGALSSTTFPLDRLYVSSLLSFSNITQNAMDAVSDRDYVLDFIYSSSVCMMHLSRFCEEIITWASNEYSFIELDDEYSTGSSIMPQKKNPDAAELIRGKTGRIYGDLIALLTTMKGLPLAYNKDMQEDKKALFDAHDTIVACITIFTAMIKTASFNKENMQKSAKNGYTNATDAADYLVNKSVPFRKAHEIIGMLVKLCIEKKCSLDELSLNEYKNIYFGFEKDIYNAIDILNCVKKRKIIGGCSPDTVNAHIKNARDYIAYL